MIMVRRDQDGFGRKPRIAAGQQTRHVVGNPGALGLLRKWRESVVSGKGRD